MRLSQAKSFLGLGVDSAQKRPLAKAPDWDSGSGISSAYFRLFISNA